MYPNTYISVEDPRRQQLQNEFPPVIDDKELFRLSIASQQSSATATTATSNSSSQRLSMGSCDDDINNNYYNNSSNHVAYSSPIIPRSTLNSNTSLPPSSRYLLSGSSTSENFRNKILNKFIPSSTSSSNRHQKSLSEPSFDNIDAMPDISSLEIVDTNNTVIDPWCVSVKFALENSINCDWLHKYEQPSAFGFGRSWKRRLFILVDRIVFVFKSSKATNPAREHFQLTEDTFVFVTEEFKKGYIIELRKPLSKWYIRCDSVTQMRSWLESMKKIVACIKIGYTGLLSTSVLSSIKLTDDYRILVPVNATLETSRKLHRQSLPPLVVSQQQQQNTTNPVTRKHSLPSKSIARPPSRSSLLIAGGNNRQSLSDIPDWESMLPPQLPPPRSKPPPVPPLLATVSEDY